MCIGTGVGEGYNNINYIQLLEWQSQSERYAVLNSINAEGMIAYELEEKQ